MYISNPSAFRKIHADKEILTEFEKLMKENIFLRGGKMSEHDNARTDVLTLINNRRGYVERLDRLARESKNPICILKIDLDHFKKTNDTEGYGHNAGDEVLQAVAMEMSHLFSRRSHPDRMDVIGRIGGDEFEVAFTCPAEKMAHQAKIMAEKLRKAIAKTGRDVSNKYWAALGVKPDHQPCATASIGIAIVKGGNIACARRMADKAAYEAKEVGGRNCVYSTTNGTDFTRLSPAESSRPKEVKSPQAPKANSGVA